MVIYRMGEILIGGISSGTCLNFAFIPRSSVDWLIVYASYNEAVPEDIT